jgi:hypothetical protein
MVLRLSARPDDRSGLPPRAPKDPHGSKDGHAPLFRRFFALLEKLLPDDGAPETKTGQPAEAKPIYKGPKP